MGLHGSRSLRILVVHSELPLHDRHSGSLRLFRLLELLAGEGHAVTFLARRGLGQERYVAELTALGIEVHPVDRARLRELGARLPGPELDFEELCARGRFDVALLSFYDLAEQYLPLLRRCSPLTRVVVDTVDVHHVRERRGAELSGDPLRLAAAERTRDREQAIYGAADALIAVSADDAAALRELTPEVPVHVVSNIHDEVPAGPGLAERAGIVFVANFAHAPNVDAIVDFHASTWPLVRAALPGVRLSLVGSDPPVAVRDLATDDVEVTGWVPSTVPYLDRARVSIAPLRYGAGVKGKIGEALSHGLPVVTTTIGAEGMGLTDGEHALIADAPEAFAAAVALAYSDDVLWERLAAAGRAHIESTLSPDAARGALRGLLRDAVPAAFVLPAAPGVLDAVAPALAGYLSAFEPDDPVSLVLAVPPEDPDAPALVFDAAAAALAQLGRDPEAVPDIAVTGWSSAQPLPAGATLVVTARGAMVGSESVPDAAPRPVDAGPEPIAAARREPGGATAHLASRAAEISRPTGGNEHPPIAPLEVIRPDADAADWRAAAAPTPRSRRPSPRAALLLHAPDDAAAFAAQLHAVAAAGMPDDIELVIAAGDPAPEVEALLASASGARVIRTGGALGRMAGWQLGAMATRAPHVVALSPLALPVPGFLAPLLGGVATGAALVAPVVAGAHGLHVADDGSLWPIAAGQTGTPTAADRSAAHGFRRAASLDALPLDCLAGTRELFAAGLPALPSGEGHREAQLAAWAAGHGGIALAPGARVDRLPAPPASVLICTRNRADELPDGVALLVANGAIDVVIVDNGSTDATPEVAAELAARFPGVVRVVGEPNAGLCHARNAGAAAARHELLLYVDDDARVAPGWLEHTAHTLSREGVVNVGGPICALWPAERPDGWPGRDLEALLSVLDLGDAERALAPPDVVYGANWAVRRSALTAVGGFDPAFGPGPGVAINGDEVSVAWRLHRAGLGSTRYAPGAAVGHRIPASRVGDFFMLHRALCVGVERPRHAVALGDAPHAKLVADAGRAAQQLLSLVPLNGVLTVGAALDAIGAAGLPLSAGVQAGIALGELAACVLLTGECEATAGAMTLSVHPEVLQGAVAPALAR